MLLGSAVPFCNFIPGSDPGSSESITRSTGSPSTSAPLQVLNTHPLRGRDRRVNLMHPAVPREPPITGPWKTIVRSESLIGIDSTDKSPQELLSQTFGITQQAAKRVLLESNSGAGVISIDQTDHAGVRHIQHRRHS